MIVKSFYGAKNRTKKNQFGKSNINYCKLKRGHSKEVFCIDWSEDNSYLISGGLDNKVIIWDTFQGQILQQFNEAEKYVKIVAIDNKAQYFFSLACDKKLRMYKSNTQEFKMIYESKQQEQNEKDYQIFKSDWDLMGFFRQAQWAPDGSFFIVPQGLQKYKKNKINCAFAYSRSRFDKPSLVIPNEKPVLMVRFSQTKTPLNNSIPLFKSKYKMYFAIATFDSITIYQSTQLSPLFYLRGIHYAPLTDMSWYSNEFLLISSMDGYISIAQFENLEEYQDKNVDSTIEVVQF